MRHRWNNNNNVAKCAAAVECFEFTRERRSLRAHEILAVADKRMMYDICAESYSDAHDTAKVRDTRANMHNYCRGAVYSVRIYFVTLYNSNIALYTTNTYYTKPHAATADIYKYNHAGRHTLPT